LLSQRGLKKKETLAEIPDKKELILRTHGTNKNSYKNIKERSKRINNLCCSKVTYIQSKILKASKSDTHCIILGKKNHPEVESLVSYAKQSTVISNKDELNLIPAADKYLFVSQSTFDESEFIHIGELLLNRFDNKLTIENTICNSTHKKQISVRNLIQSADILIVVGGKKSSNTRELANIANEFDKTSYHIEDETELKKSWFSSNSIIVLTSGASTPDFLLEAVYFKLKRISKQNEGVLISIFSFLSNQLFYLFIAQLAFPSLVVYSVTKNIQTTVVFSFLLTLSLSLFELHRSYNKKFSYFFNSLILCSFITLLIFLFVIGGSPLNSYLTIYISICLFLAIAIFSISTSRLPAFIRLFFNYESAIIIVPLIYIFLAYETPLHNYFLIFFASLISSLFRHTNYELNSLSGIVTLTQFLPKRNKRKIKDYNKQFLILGYKSLVFLIFDLLLVAVIILSYF
jgi:4-hydroxy-3-methylbut-2-enyl diphosphate reductase